MSKCSAQCPESNDVPHVGVDHSRRELTRSGQVLVGSGQVIYQNVQLDILNPMIYYTWDVISLTHTKPPTTLNPDSPLTFPAMVYGSCAKIISILLFKMYSFSCAVECLLRCKLICIYFNKFLELLSIINSGSYYLFNSFKRSTV